MKRKTLVAFYSRTGTTRRMARSIAATLDADLEDIVDVDPREGLRGYMRSSLDAMLGRDAVIGRAKLNPADYDLVVVGSPVWNASVSSPVRAFLNRHRHALDRLALFCTCDTTGGGRAIEQMERVARKTATAALVLRAEDAIRDVATRKIERFADQAQGRRTIGTVVAIRPADSPRNMIA
jgi:menaquinone-dependent protoporphyrinogen IX oxidase